MTVRFGTRRVLLQHFGGGVLEDYALGASEAPGAGGFCVGNTMTVRFGAGRVLSKYFGGGPLQGYTLGFRGDRGRVPFWGASQGAVGRPAGRLFGRRLAGPPCAPLQGAFASTAPGCALQGTPARLARRGTRVRLCKAPSHASRSALQKAARSAVHRHPGWGISGDGTSAISPGQGRSAILRIQIFPGTFRQFLRYKIVM